MILKQLETGNGVRSLIAAGRNCAYPNLPRTSLKRCLRHLPWHSHRFHGSNLPITHFPLPITHFPFPIPPSTQHQR